MTPEELEKLAEQMKKFETFVERRFDELSMEVNATSQQLDMAGNDITGQMSEVLSVLSAVSQDSGAGSQANAGYELEAVVAATDKAANDIMDAAERIVEKLSDKDALDQKETRDSIVTDVEAEVQNILMACSFQDLTSQRIRTAVDNISGIQDRLGDALEKMGIKAEAKPETLVDDVSATKQTSQDDIDAMFS